MQAPVPRGKTRASEGAICALCGAPIAAEIFPFTSHLQSPIARRLEKERPGWSASGGVCPECAHDLADLNRRMRSKTSIHEELLVPFPVYSHDEARLVPTPQRLGSNWQYTGKGVTIAFIDSGYYPHPDLTRPENRILCCVDTTGTEPVELASFNKPQLTSWHGLMVACVAAGNGIRSRMFYRGIACQANLVLVKTGKPQSLSISEEDIGRGLEWVLANRERFNIRIVNISLGGDHPTRGPLSELDKLVEKAVASGLVVVCAAGNDGTQRMVPPASAPSAITVGGLDDRHTDDPEQWRMYHSNYGRGAAGSPKPEIIAPAAWVAAPMLPHTSVHQEGRLLWYLNRVGERLAGGSRLEGPETNRNQLAGIKRHVRMRMIDHKYIHPHYQHVEGTSMAASITTSVVAQMLEANPSLEPAQVKSILINSAQPMEGSPAELQGAGVINAAGAVAAARHAAGGPLEGVPISPYINTSGGRLTPAESRNTGREVTFTYYDPQLQAEHVALTGSFNNWDPDGYELHKQPKGFWQLSVSLPPGTHRYKFLVDSKHWVVDPENSRRSEDGYGKTSSIVEILQ